MLDDAVIAWQAIDESGLGGKRPPVGGATQTTDSMVINELIEGPFVTSYNDDGRVKTEPVV